jgi:hypothetical protein
MSILEPTRLTATFPPLLQLIAKDIQNRIQNITGGSTCPTFGNPVLEWTQLADPSEEYEPTLLGAPVAGIVIMDKISPKDFVFSHPFCDVEHNQWDYEIWIAPDKQYEPVLARGNVEDGKVGAVDEYKTSIQLVKEMGLQDVHGIIGVETDSGLVPEGYRAKAGDRVLVYGRWIVDCGHNEFHTEIHPPLLHICARPEPNFPERLTEMYIVARPYLVSQRYEPDKWPFASHMVNEVLKMQGVDVAGIPIPLSRGLGAHPILKDKPFDGIHTVTFAVSPPTPRQNPEDILYVSYRFTVHSESVRVGIWYDANEQDKVQVGIALSSYDYAPPPEPPRKNKTWSWEELIKLEPSVGTDYGIIQAIEVGIASGADAIVFPIFNPWYAGIADWLIHQGIQTHSYGPLKAPSVDDLPAQFTAASINICVNDLPQDFFHPASRIVDESQPFPVIGWLKAYWGPLRTEAGTILPFVREVMVIQAASDLPISGFGTLNDCMETNVRYHAIWEDRRVELWEPISNRELVHVEELLSPTHEAYVFITFSGPTEMKRVSRAILNLSYENHSRIVVTLQEAGDSRGYYYWGSFNPSALSKESYTLTMAIDAFDDADPNLEIDSNPTTVAYVENGNPPVYYEPGVDDHYHVQVAPLITQHDITETANDSFAHAYLFPLETSGEPQARSAILGSGENYIQVTLSGQRSGSLGIPFVGIVRWAFGASVEESEGFRLILNICDSEPEHNPCKDVQPDNPSSFKIVQLSENDSIFYVVVTNPDFACQGEVSYQLEVWTNFVIITPPLQFKQFLLRIPRDDRWVWGEDSIQYQNPQSLIEDVEGHLDEFLMESGFVEERERGARKGAILHSLGQVAQMARLNREAERLYVQSTFIFRSQHDLVKEVEVLQRLRDLYTTLGLEDQAKRISTRIVEIS